MAPTPSSLTRAGGHGSTTNPTAPQRNDKKAAEANTLAELRARRDARQSDAVRCTLPVYTFDPRTMLKQGSEQSSAEKAGRLLSGPLADQVLTKPGSGKSDQHRRKKEANRG